MTRKGIVSGLLSVVLFITLSTPVLAVCNDYECDDCPVPLIDFECQQKKLIDIYSSCTILYCPVSGSSTTDADLNLNFFGVNIRIDSKTKVASLIYLGFMGFLGIVAVATAALGVYGAYLRARGDVEGNVEKSTKVLRNALIGFVLVGLSLLITQLVASFIGIGSIVDMVNF